MKACFKMTLAVFVISMGFSSTLASEKAVKMKDLPTAVQRTVQEQSKGVIQAAYVKNAEALGAGQILNQIGRSFESLVAVEPDIVLVHDSSSHLLPVGL